MMDSEKVMELAQAVSDANARLDAADDMQKQAYHDSCIAEEALLDYLSSVVTKVARDAEDDFDGTENMLYEPTDKPEKIETCFIAETEVAPAQFQIAKGPVLLGAFKLDQYDDYIDSCTHFGLVALPKTLAEESESVDGDGAEECADSAETASDEPAPVVNTNGAEEIEPSPVIDATGDADAQAFVSQAVYDEAQEAGISVQGLKVSQPLPTVPTVPDYGPVADEVEPIVWGTYFEDDKLYTTANGAYHNSWDVTHPGQVAGYWNFCDKVGLEPL